MGLPNIWLLNVKFYGRYCILVLIQWNIKTPGFNEIFDIQHF